MDKVHNAILREEMQTKIADAIATKVIVEELEVERDAAGDSFAQRTLGAKQGIRERDPKTNSKMFHAVYDKGSIYNYPFEILTQAELEAKARANFDRGLSSLASNEDIVEYVACELCYLFTPDATVKEQQKAGGFPYEDPFARSLCEHVFRTHVGRTQAEKIAAIGNLLIEHADDERYNLSDANLMGVLCGDDLLVVQDAPGEFSAVVHSMSVRLPTNN